MGLSLETNRNKSALVSFSNNRSMRNGKAIINLVDVFKIYESAAGRFSALKGINLNIKPGEFVAVVGKSGSGKSTLMNMITGIDRPTTGEVYVSNVAIHNLSEGKVALWRGKTLGIVFQFFQLLPTLTVIENIMLPMDFCHMYSLRERRERALQLLEEVELADQAFKLPSTLSGGQQQRVAIARALANDPPIIVADEPTGNLDTKTAASIYNLFMKLISEGKTILMVTHDQDIVNEVSRTIYLLDGRIVDESGYQSTHVDMQLDPSKHDEDEVGLSFDQEEHIRKLVSSILIDLPNASMRLKRELFEADWLDINPSVGEDIYMIVMDEISVRAKIAESLGKTAEAKQYWQILLEATK